MDTYSIIEKNDTVIQEIQNVLNSFPEFNLTGIAGDYDAAMNMSLKENPNIIFLCVDKTIKNPFCFMNELNRFSEKLPKIIAISASKNKAYNAIKADVYDFLLKPLSELEIRKSVLRVKKEMQMQSQNTICLKSYKDFRYLNTEEILFLKADNNTTDFHMKDGNVISAYKTLKTFEEILPVNFLRIHKSYIINSKYVSRINYGKLICSINSNSFNIPFTKTYIDNIESINKVLSNSSFVNLN